MFNDTHNRRLYFAGDCGDIIITGCTLNNCYSKNPGGSIYICQNCTAIINNSKTDSSEGGAIFAVKAQDSAKPNYD